MAFGAVRKAYSAPCKFHADEVAGNRINWYRVPSDRQVYDGLHVFHPRVDVDSKSITGLFEKEGPGRFVRQFEPGFDVYGFPGTHVDGDAQDFLGKSLVAKHFFEGELIAPLACVGIGTNPAGIRLGATIGEGPYHADLAFGAEEFFAAFFSSDPDMSGRMFKGRKVTKASVDFDAHHAFFPIVEGQKYRVDLVFPTDVSWAWALSEGATFGTSTPIAGENPELNHRVFIEFEAIADGFAFLTVEQLGAVLGTFEAVYWEEPFPPTIEDAGVRLGASVADPPPPFGTVSAGIALGAVEESADSDYTLAAGLKLGGVEADGGTITPGTDCESAALVTVPHESEHDIGASEIHEFKFEATADQEYFVKVTPTTETFTTHVHLYAGTDCMDRTNVLSFPFGVGCSTYTPLTNTTIWVQIDVGETSPDHYILEIGEGACP